MSVKNLLLSSFIIFMILGLSCSKSANLPPEPELSLISARYIEEEITVGIYTLPQYSIKLEFAYQDGDEDLGVLQEDLANGLRYRKYVKDQNDDLILIGSLDGLPEFNCQDYEILQADSYLNAFWGDTVLIDRSHRTGNLIIDFFIENQNQDFVPFEQIDFFPNAGCTPDFNHYILDVNETIPPGVSYSVTRDGSRRGTIVVDLIYSGFNYWLDIADFRMEVKMYDRTGNESNTITTGVISK